MLVAASGLFFVTYFPENLRNIVLPSPERLRGVAIRISNDTLYTNLDLKLENKGLFKINLDSIYYDVRLDTTRLLAGDQDLQVILKSGDADTFAIPLKLPFRQIQAQIEALQERDSAEIRSDITLVYQTVFGKFRLPHKELSYIPVPRPPEIEIKKVEFVSLSKMILSLQVTIAFINKGSIMLQASNLKYDILGGELFSAAGSLDRTFEVLPRATTIEAFPVAINLKKPLKTAYFAISGKKLPYTAVVRGLIKMNKVMDSTAVEVSKSGELEILK